MYKLTPRMLQRFREDLTKYHDLFGGNRCQGWEQEELLVKAINSDYQTQHAAFWKEAGHDIDADIRVRTNDDWHFIQVKSGQVRQVRGSGEKLVISGYRLGRFGGNFHEIADFLNTNKTDIISVSYKKSDDEFGRHHNYCVRYVDAELITNIEPAGWVEHGTQFRKYNRYGTLFTLNPTMSWQIWWLIPIDLVEVADSFTI